MKTQIQANHDRIYNGECKILKFGRAFDFEGTTLYFVERNEPYGNASITMTRVLAPNGGRVPVNFYTETVKGRIEEVHAALLSFRSRGADVKHELTKQL